MGELVEYLALAGDPGNIENLIGWQVPNEE
jgi:hypothetical protein